MCDLAMDPIRGGPVAAQKPFIMASCCLPSSWSNLVQNKLYISEKHESLWPTKSPHDVKPDRFGQ